MENISREEISGTSGNSGNTFKTEDQFLAACFAWAWNTFPQTRRLLFHVPNELKRLPGESQGSHVRRLSEAKAKGVVPGEPDLVLVWCRRVYGFELKMPNGTVSDDQALVHFAWNEHGAKVYIPRTLERFQELFTQIILSK
jgi:hypothetical protein